MNTMNTSKDMNAEAEDDLEVCFEDGNVERDDDNEEERESDSEGYVDVDEEDEGLPHEWTENIFEYQRVIVSLEDVDSDLRKRLREAVERLSHRIESSRRSQTFAYDVNDAHVGCDELNNFIAFADTKFWCHLIEFLNKSRGMGVQAVDGRTMTKFIRCILWCAYYQKSPGHLIENQYLFSGFSSALQALGGVSRLKEIIALFASPKKKLGTTWDAYFSMVPDIRKLVRIVSENCSAIVFFGSPNDITVDDDKWRFRSSNWSQLGYSRRKGLKSFGCVLNMACESPTGLFVSGTMTQFGDSATNSMKIILQRALHVETTSELNMNGAMINGDRGYNDDAFLSFCDRINASVFFTVKRGPTLPFAFGATSYRCTREQRVIPESGTQTVYTASRTIDGNGNKLHLCAYRNGTGRVVFFASSKGSFDGTKWSLVMEKESDKRRFLNTCSDLEPTMQDQWKSTYCVSRGLQQLTECQRTPEWFLLRKFCVTSTVAAKALDKDARFYTEDERQWLLSRLCMRCNSTVRAIDFEYAEKNEEELLKMRKNDLVDICKSYGHSTTGTKTALVARIKSGINPNVTEKTEVERLAQAWFMKPLPKKQCLRLGSVNESNVLGAISHIHLFDPNMTVEKGPAELGLVRRSDKPWLATSVDGLLEIDAYGTIYPTALEIKTMSSATTLAEARRIGTELNKITSCRFGDHIFKKGVKKQYRVQCIHHACVMKVDRVLYTVASDRNIIYMLFIEFTPDDLEMYEKLLDPLSVTLDWVYGTAPFPTDDFGHGLQQRGYHVDIHSVRLTLQLWRSTHLLIEQHNGKPLPPCRYIAPTGIAYWNRNKGFVDVMSRLLSHIKIPFKRGGPVLQLVVRFLSIMIANGHLTTNLLRLSDEDFVEDGCSYTDMKKKMSNKASLNDYLKVLATNFVIPGYVLTEPDTSTDAAQEGPTSNDFSQIPTDRILNTQELIAFKGIISKKRKVHKVFNEGVAKKIRLESSYRHIMVPVDKQGRCVYCTLKNMNRWPKYKCKTCGVFLCLSAANGARLSCFEKWHSKHDLTK